MDLFGGRFLNNYTSPIINKKQLEDFLNNINNEISILHEEYIEVIKEQKLIKNLLS